MKNPPKNPAQARLCEECSGIVTISEICPLCDGKTEPHPEAGEANGFCCLCGGGFPMPELHVITWEENAYLQTDEGDLITACDLCRDSKEMEP